LINPALRKIYDEVFMKSLVSELDDKRMAENEQKRKDAYRNPSVFGNFRIYKTAIPNDFDFDKIEGKK